MFYGVVIRALLCYRQTYVRAHLYNNALGYILLTVVMLAGTSVLR